MSRFDPRSASYIKDKAVQSPVNLIELRNSGHIATMGQEKLLIAEEIIKFIDQAQVDGSHVSSVPSNIERKDF